MNIKKIMKKREEFEEKISLKALNDYNRYALSVGLMNCPKLLEYIKEGKTEGLPMEVTPFLKM